MDDPPERTDDRWDGRYVAPVREVGRRASVVPWVVVATAALVLVVLKPWGSIAAPGPSGSAPGSLTLLDPARNDPDLLGRCHNTDAWLLSTVETSRGDPVRVLRVLSPVAAVEPDDPAIPRVVFGAERVTELGWCAPVVGPDSSPGVAAVEAWSLVAGHAQRLAIREDVPGGSAAFGMLYRAPQGASVDRPRGQPVRGGAAATVLAERHLRVRRPRHGGRRPHLRHRPRDHPAARPGRRRSGSARALSGSTTIRDRRSLAPVGCALVPGVLQDLHRRPSPASDPTAEFWRRTPCPSEDAPRFCLRAPCS